MLGAGEEQQVPTERAGSRSARHVDGARELEARLMSGVVEALRYGLAVRRPDPGYRSAPATRGSSPYWQGTPRFARKVVPGYSVG